MEQEWYWLMAIIGLLLLNMAFSNQDGHKDYFNEFFNEPVYPLFFGLVGAGAYVIWAEQNKRPLSILEAAFAFVAGYFVIKFALDWMLR